MYLTRPCGNRNTKTTHRAFACGLSFFIFTEGTAMNSLILTLDAGAGCCLPIAYQQLTQ